MFKLTLLFYVIFLYFILYQKDVIFFIVLGIIMSNYDDTPSMEEILQRIKTALRNREQKTLSDSLDFATDNNQDLDTKLNDNNVNTQYKDENIFIKPNLNTDNDDVFILSKDMKINQQEKNIENVFHQISVIMANDLNVPYLATRIENWLLNNFFSIYKKYKQ